MDLNEKKKLNWMNFLALFYFFAGMILLVPLGFLIAINVLFGVSLERPFLTIGMGVSILALIVSVWLFYQFQNSLQTFNQLVYKRLKTYLIIVLIGLTFYHPLLLTADLYFNRFTINEIALFKPLSILVIILRHFIGLFIAVKLYKLIKKYQTIYLDGIAKALMLIVGILYVLNVTLYVVSIQTTQFIGRGMFFISPIFLMLLLIAFLLYRKLNQFPVKKT